MCPQVPPNPSPPQPTAWKTDSIAGNALFVHTISAYVVWVLLGVVAYIGHLGAQAPMLAPFLPGGGQPGGKHNLSADGMLEFWYANIGACLGFVLPHSFLRPRRLSSYLATIGLQSYDRLLYNVIAAASLHFFLCTMVPLRTPVVMKMPFPPLVHLVLSAGCLVYAAACFLANPKTTILLGVSRALGRPDGNGLVGMDAITWMGECVWERGGATAFVLFTGLSILPPELTLGDTTTRVVAAMYLRARSSSFRKWVHRIESAHQLTWVLRGGLGAVALHQAAASSELFAFSIFDWRVIAAISIALSLRAFEVFDWHKFWLRLRKSAARS